ncbi:MAG: ABC transporter substrate-binding protein [Anaerolineae bacterium]|nr:ABC transporter substrate-binding protein [Anaerolineae bacterium]
MKNRRHDHFLLIFILCMVTGLLSGACKNSSQAKHTVVIGVVIESEPLVVTFDGLRKGMADLGYVEGDNITYIFNGVVGSDLDDIDHEVEGLLAKKVDLFFTPGTVPTLRVKQAVEGTDIPVIFAPVINPVDAGVVDSLSYPGGNVTGVETGDTLPKAMEWLITIAPATNFYVPYHPDDVTSVSTIPVLMSTAATLGIDVTIDEVSSPEDVVAAIRSLPEDTDVLFVPMARLEAGLDDYAAAAMECDVAIGSYQPSYMRNGILVNFSVDLFEMGKQASRLVDQALRGASPAELPVETADGFLTINLVTAEAIGLEIPNHILRLANTVIY